MEPRRFYANWRALSFFIRIGGTVFALKSPKLRPLWSERNLRGVRVLPLIGGWRVTWRTGGKR
ncbi:hypothetical protein [Novosphingobium sp. M1R2S20]|uniref:Uncharacterized protein n=1 Tax=Novosphingobium rhizovicinum TaxID=3228928 RepID=A0ABV3RCW2_9SPHN